MSNIFISYNRYSEAIVKTLVDDIETLGHTVWFDQELKGGQTWWNQILAKVRDCEVFVFVLDPKALNSMACKSEYSYAADLGKPILPVLVAEGMSTNLLPPVLSQIQFVDYRKQDRAAVLRLARALTTVPPLKPLPDPLPLPPDVPISYLGRLAEQIEMPSTLDYEKQSALVFDLKRSLRDPEIAEDALALLERLRKRRDLLATIAEEIDELLGSIGKASSALPRASKSELPPQELSLETPRSQQPQASTPADNPSLKKQITKEEEIDSPSEALMPEALNSEKNFSSPVEADYHQPAGERKQEATKDSVRQPREEESRQSQRLLSIKHIAPWVFGIIIIGGVGALMYFVRSHSDQSQQQQGKAPEGIHIEQKESEPKAPVQQPSQAEHGQPPRSDTVSESQKQASTVMDSSGGNVSIDQLLIPATAWMVKRGLSIKEITDSRKVTWPQAYREATEKYSEQVKISQDGREIYNYVAGAPFLSIDFNDPLAGSKIMWNHEHGPMYGDSVRTGWTIEKVNAKGAVERTYKSNFWRRLRWNGRLYNDPKPVVPHNPALTYTEHLGPLFSPNDMKGNGLLNYRYAGLDIPDDSYMYLPELCRVRRVSVANRSDAFWGMDLDIDSIWGWNAKVSYWTFRALAAKEILAVMHSGEPEGRSAWCAPRDGQHGLASVFPCVPWEKRKVWVVEATPSAYSQYAYSKRILYIDQDTFAPLFTENYDQGGELWKVFFNIFNFKKQLSGMDEWAFTPHWLMIDVKTNGATAWDAPSDQWYFNEDGTNNSPDIYSVNYLIQSAR